MSEIGFIVRQLYKDKINEIKLRGKERVKLQKRLAILTSESDNVEVVLEPGIYGQDGKPLPAPPRDMEFEQVVFEWYRAKKIPL